MVDESGTTTYSYDERNMLKEIKKDGEAYISYTYDEIGNIESVTDVKGFTTTYTYDKSSRMKTVTYGGNTTTYSYDNNGNRKSITYDGGVREEYGYDKNNRLLNLINKKPNGSIISNYSYTYDLAGRQITKTDSYGTTKYSYDEVGRVLRIETPGKTTIYSYDNASNRETLNETYTSPQPSRYIDEMTQNQIQYKQKKSEYIYSPANMLLKLVEKMYDEEGNEVIEKTTRYLYDYNGNEIRQLVSYILPHNMTMHQNTKGSVHGEGVKGDISTLIEKVESTFDGFNRLKKVDRVKDGERNIVTYIYNGDGLRIRKEVQKSSEGYIKKVTNYYYDRQHVILETNEAGNLKARYVRGLNYIARYGEVNDISYYLYNGHGDVVQTVSETGEILNQYDYDIFGNPTLTVEIQKNSIRYAGEFYDEETGLYYLRARYYNAYIGRFIGEDSYWGEDLNPFSLNLYTYCYNDPIKYIDPTGNIVSEADKKNLSKEDQNKIQEATDRYNNAKTDAEREAAHRDAEAIRAKAGYSGGTDGRRYIREGKSSSKKKKSSSEKEKLIIGDKEVKKPVENYNDYNYYQNQNIEENRVLSDEEFIKKLNEELTYDPTFIDGCWKLKTDDSHIGIYGDSDTSIEFIDVNESWKFNIYDNLIVAYGVSEASVEFVSDIGYAPGTDISALETLGDIAKGIMQHSKEVISSIGGKIRGIPSKYSVGAVIFGIIWEASTIEAGDPTDEELKEMEESKEGTGNNERKTNVRKQESDVYNGFDKVKGKDRRTSGHGKKQRYYEWDHTHNDIEVYNSKGKHLGSMDPVTGEMYKPPVKGRMIEID